MSEKRHDSRHRMTKNIHLKYGWCIVKSSNLNRLCLIHIPVASFPNSEFSSLHHSTLMFLDPGIDGVAFSASRMSEDEFELKQPRMSESEWGKILLNREQIWFLNVIFSYSQLCCLDENIFQALKFLDLH